MAGVVCDVTVDTQLTRMPYAASSRESARVSTTRPFFAVELCAFRTAPMSAVSPASVLMLPRRASIMAGAGIDAVKGTVERDRHASRAIARTNVLEQYTHAHRCVEDEDVDAAKRSSTPPQCVDCSGSAMSARYTSA